MCGLAASTLASSPSLAVISQQFFVSDNNKLYYVVVSVPSAGAIGSQVTSLMMTSGTALRINETANNPPDPVVTSFGTAVMGAILRFPPLSNIRRTQLLTGFPSNHIENADPCNPNNGCFDPHAHGGDGLLRLPGVSGQTVTFDGSGTETVGPITTATGAGSTLVPAATNVDVTRVIGIVHFIDVPTIVFPNPAGPVVTSSGGSCVGGTNAGAPCDPRDALAPNPDCPGGSCTNFGGETAGQNVTLDDTLSSRIGNPVSQGATVDGFFLPDTKAIIVFMVDDGATAFGLTATGFAVTGTCSNASTSCVLDSDCPGGSCGTDLAARDVIDTTGDISNAPPLPPPTDSRTATGTNTPTETPTQTSTTTPSSTTTATFTAAGTRPPIPVIPSPASPAGLMMVGGLAVVLLWALRARH
ncbi:MAG TPA: hypothetical protein VL049_19780 [Candidatus Dormibacteraeota bacterium]|nr:hypothetical protein [Candidatus Dormibacteraeota bacterium]